MDRRLVARSGYDASSGRSAVDAAPPPDAVALAAEAAARAPEPAVVVDVAHTGDGAVKLVEYNLLSGADLYGCDPAAVVAALTP